MGLAVLRGRGDRSQGLAASAEEMVKEAMPLVLKPAVRFSDAVGNEQYESDVNEKRNDWHGRVGFGREMYICCQWQLLNKDTYLML